VCRYNPGGTLLACFGELLIAKLLTFGLQQLTNTGKIHPLPGLTIEYEQLEGDVHRVLDVNSTMIREVRP
jgi:hypothetical protein